MRKERFADILALPGLVLATAMGCYGQAYPTAPAPPPAQQRKQPFTLFQNVGTEQQQQFCLAFQEDDARQRDFETKVAAAVNPIQKKLIEKDKPDFDFLLHAQQYAVMGKGVFHGWSGHIRFVTEGRGDAFIVELPCKWTDHRARIGSKSDTLILREPIVIDSIVAKELATISQGEAITASGSFSCSPLNGCETFSCSPINGCEAWYSGLKGTITSIRLKNGSVVHLYGEDWKPESGFENVSALSKGAITFYRSDDLTTLKTKARAMLWQNPSRESVRLTQFLNPGTGAAFKLISLSPVELNEAGQVGKKLRPCERSGLENLKCADEVGVYVEGDMPSLADVGQIEHDTFVLGKNGDCYAISLENETALQQRRHQIDELLQPLGKQLEPNPAASRSNRNPCEPLIAVTTKEMNRLTNAAKQRVEDTKAVSVTIAADEFDARLRAAVQSRALKLGADPSRYESAIRSVSEIVRMCSSMTEADFAGSMTQYGGPNLRRYENGKYQECMPVALYRAIPEDKDQPGLMIRHDLQEHWDGLQKRWYATKFHVTVFLKPLTTMSPPPTLADFDAQHIAISAEIANNGLPAEPRFLCPGAHINRGSFARDGDRIVSAPTKVTRLQPGPRPSDPVSVWLEGDGLHSAIFRSSVEQLKSSCTSSGRP